MNSLCIVQYKGVSKRFETDVISKGYDFINQIASIPKKLLSVLQLNLSQELKCFLIKSQDI